MGLSLFNRSPLLRVQLVLVCDPRDRNIYIHIHDCRLCERRVVLTSLEFVDGPKTSRTPLASVTLLVRSQVSIP